MSEPNDVYEFTVPQWKYHRQKLRIEELEYQNARLWRLVIKLCVANVVLTVGMVFTACIGAMR